MLPHSWKGCKADMAIGFVDDMLVDLVGDHKCIIFDGNVGDCLKLVKREDFSARVGRVAQNQSLGSFLKPFLYQGKVECAGGRHERNIDGTGSAKYASAPYFS